MMIRVKKKAIKMTLVLSVTIVELMIAQKMSLITMIMMTRNKVMHLKILIVRKKK